MTGRRTQAAVVVALCGFAWLAAAAPDARGEPPVAVFLNRVTAGADDTVTAQVQWLGKPSGVSVEVRDMWHTRLWEKRIEQPADHGQVVLQLSGLAPWRTYEVVAHAAGESASNFFDVTGDLSRSLRVIDTESYFSRRDDVDRFARKIREAHLNVVRFWGWNPRLNGSLPQEERSPASNETGLPPDVDSRIVPQLLTELHRTGVKVQGYTAGFADADTLAEHPEFAGPLTHGVYGYNLIAGPAFQAYWRGQLAGYQKKLGFDGFWVDYCPGSEDITPPPALAAHPMVLLRNALAPGSLLNGNQGPWPDERMNRIFPEGSIGSFCWEQAHPRNVKADERTWLNVPQAAQETRRLRGNDHTAIWFQEGAMPEPENYEVMLALAKASRAGLSTESRSAIRFVDLTPFRKFEAFYAGLFDAPARDLPAEGIHVESANAPHPNVFASMYATDSEKKRVVHLVNLTGVPTRRADPAVAPTPLLDCTVEVPLEANPQSMYVLSPGEPASPVTGTYDAARKAVRIKLPRVSLWTVVVCLMGPAETTPLRVAVEEGPPSSKGQPGAAQPASPFLSVANGTLSPRYAQPVAVPVEGDDLLALQKPGQVLEDQATGEQFIFQLDPTSARAAELLLVADFSPGQTRNLVPAASKGRAGSTPEEVTVHTGKFGREATFAVSNGNLTLEYYAPWGGWRVRSTRVPFSYNALKDDGALLRTGYDLSNAGKSSSWWGFIPRTWKVVSSGPVRAVLEEEGSFNPLSFWTKRSLIVYAGGSSVTEVLQMKPVQAVNLTPDARLTVLFNRGNLVSLAPAEWRGLQVEPDKRRKLPDQGKMTADWFAAWRKNGGGGFGLIRREGARQMDTDLKLGPSELATLSHLDQLPKDADGWRTLPLEWVFFDLDGDSNLVEQTALQDRSPPGVLLHGKPVNVSEPWHRPVHDSLEEKYKAIFGTRQLTDDQKRELDKFTN